MKKLISFAILIASFNCYAQITFEKGYFITNSGERVECLIKNIDWRNNPSEIIYKLNDNSLKKHHTIKNIKEFGVYNTSKYINVTVDIDQSSAKIKSLSYDRRPEFKTKKVFLKTVVEGKANLYSYTQKGHTLFFYNINNSPIKQLIYKRYKVSQFKIGENFRYKQQLVKDLKCENLKRTDRINYKLKDLSQYFIKYNDCYNANKVLFTKQKKRKSYSLTIKAGVSSSYFSTINHIPIDNSGFSDFSGLNLGIEAEYYLPFNKNKWALTFEPSYQSTKTNFNTVLGFASHSVDFEHKSVQLPLGIKHNFFLNKNSRIFLTAAYAIEFTIDRSIMFNKIVQNVERIRLIGNFNYTFGFKYKKYSIELRYNQRSFSDFLSNFRTLNINLGYTLF